METITEIIGIKLSKEEAIAIAEDLATCPAIGETSMALMEAMGVEQVVADEDSELEAEIEETVEQTSYVQ